MKYIKKIATGIAVLSFLVGIVIMSPAQARADNNMEDSNALFASAQASLKASALANFANNNMESSSGTFVSSKGKIGVVGAKVTSVSDNTVNATVAFGNSSLNYVVTANSATKINGKDLGNTSAASVSSLKVGDIVSFSGTMNSSTSSSITVTAEHLVSRAFINKPITDKTNFQGEVKAVNVSDNSFTLAYGNRTIKVSVTNSTELSVDGTVKTLADLKSGDKVKVVGALNTDSTIITATKVSVNSNTKVDDSNGRDGNGNKPSGNNNGNKVGFWGKIRSWFK